MCESKICFCCGKSNVKITKHHIFPRCFAKHVPDECYLGKNIIFLCKHCHFNYERKAIHFKKLIAEELNIIFDESSSVPFQIVSLSNTFIKYGMDIPIIPKIKILKKIRKHIGHRISMEELSLIVEESKNRISSGEKIMKKKIESGEIEEFILEWKNHFMSIMKPRFIPKDWVL